MLTCVRTLRVVGVEVKCLGQCPESSCLLIDVDDGPRILVDAPLEPQGMRNFPVRVRACVRACVRVM